MAARARGGATRGAGSAGVGSGSSTSVEPKPSAWTTPGAAARASAAPMTASWNPHPQRLRARAIAGAILRGAEGGAATDARMFSHRPRSRPTPPPPAQGRTFSRFETQADARPSCPPRPRPLGSRRGRGPLERRPLRRAARTRGGGRRRHRSAARPRLAQPRRPGGAAGQPLRARREAHDAPAAHALGPAPGGGRRIAVGRRAVCHPSRGRALAGRAPRAVAVVVGGALGARCRRRGRRRREPRRDAHARARRGVVGGPRARALRGARVPPAPARDVHRPGLAAGGRRRDPRPRARRLRVVAGLDRRMAARGRRAAAPHGRPARASVSLSFDTLKRLSFTHSAIYLTLLVVWIVPGLHRLEFVFGMAHGLGWIAMCVLTLAAVRARVIPLRLGIAVAVIGAVGPFVGSYEFVREERRRQATAA